MEYPSTGDGHFESRRSSSALGSMGSSDKIYPSLFDDEFRSDEEEEFPDSASGSSASVSSQRRPMPPPRPPAPRVKNYLFPQKELIEDLRPEEIRWMYKTESESKWTPFIGYDSLRIECKYREFFNYSAGNTDSENVEMVLTRGSLYEVDVITRKCFPVYWSGISYNITKNRLLIPTRNM